MSTDSPSESFLRGQGVPVALSEIDDLLARLWESAPDYAAASSQPSAPVTRVVLSNLIVADPQAERPDRDALLETLARRFPSRILVLLPGAPGDRVIRAEVTALCHLPAPGHPQVCSERIALRASQESRRLLPGAIRSLLEAELPTVLWWRGDTTSTPELYAELARECTRVIIDLDDPLPDDSTVASALDLTQNPYSRDLAWFGIIHWRELVAQFFDPPGCEKALDSLSSVEIDVASEHPTQAPRASLWLIAWLAGQLGWQGKSSQWVGPETFQARFESQGREVLTRIRVAATTEPGFPRLTQVRLQLAAEARLVLTRDENSREVRIEAQGAGHAPLPRLIQMPRWDCARRLAAALETARDDPPYRHALPHLLWMLDGSHRT